MRSGRLRHALAIVILLAASACGETAPGGGSVTRDGTRAAPTRGLDSLRLEQAFARAASLPRLHSLLVARHGELVRESYFRGPGPDAPANLKSASKSIVSALVGIAIAEGRLEGLDQPIAPFFPEIPADADPRIRRITIGNLLAMQAGLEPTSGRNYGRWVSSSDWVGFALTRPFVAEPGTGMQYSTGSTHLLSAILTRATGASTLEYARRRLFAPMGVELPAWTRGPRGIYFGGNEMSLRPRDLLTFGEMYRRGGRHRGVQLVPEAWIRESWEPRTTSRYNDFGYGLGWWMRKGAGFDVYFAWGYGGQFVFIVPALELTVVTTSDPVTPREGDHNRAVHDLLDELLIPAAEAGAER